jgi:hypothetical protein
MEVAPATAPVAGRHTWRFQQPTNDTDVRATFILLEDDMQGKIFSDAYVSGKRGFLYAPLPGEEMNIAVRDIAGTGDVHTIGDRFLPGHVDGLFIVTAVTTVQATFLALETVAAPTATTWLWCLKT